MRSLIRFPLSLLAASGFAAAQSAVIPPESPMARPGEGLQRMLLNPLEDGGVASMGRWKMRSVAVEVDAGLEPRAGQVALEFRGDAQEAGAKGDFTVSQSPAGELSQLGVWIHLRADSNVRDVGFQVTDAEGEALFARVSASWIGWRWVEQPLADAAFRPAYKQPEKNGRVDLPLKGVNIAWFTHSAGPSSFGVDGLVAVGRLREPAAPYTLQAVTPVAGEAGQPFRGQLLANNFSDAAVELDVRYTLQTNPHLHDRPLPDPVLGSNAAEGAPSWIELEGKRVDDASLTDGDEDTHYSSAFERARFTEAHHFVDLGRLRKIVALGYRSGDANWAFRLDVAGSADGANYVPVAGLEGVDIHKKWGAQKLPVLAPFDARYLRLRYHKGGEQMDVVRSPAELLVQDGVADEQIGVPRTGELLAEKNLKVTVEPRGFALVPVGSDEALAPGAYAFGLEARGPAGRQLALANYFVHSPEQVVPRPEGRFGMNVSTPAYIPQLRRLGMSWVRFENLKWRFYNPAPGDFRFDGTVKPWVVPFDDYMRQYREAGFSILPYVMQSPDWASSAGPEVKKNRNSYAPKNHDDYGSALFELAARYGATAVPVEKLKAADPRSGLNLINTYELWNEPNLNAPDWGFFVGPLENYFDLFRVGAEAVKRADPTARVSHGGWAGLSFEWIDRMRTHRYPDGKSPLDFTDIINIHFYSGRQEPETSTSDPNVYRDGTKPEHIATYERQLIALGDWRGELKPAAPIWLTEIGYDVGGKIGRSERFQAAKLPRALMIALANGVEKVFVYRETGSVPAQHAGAGVMRDDGSPRPAFFTLATLVRQLDPVADTRALRLQTSNTKVWAYAWPRGDDTLLAAWTYEGDERLGVDLGRCRVTDAFGHTREAEVNADFQLGIFPVYITRIGDRTALARLRSEAAERESARRKRREFELGARAHLYDFGSREFVGSLALGRPRPFTAVLAEDVYEPAKGHGFVGASGGKNSLRAWISSPLDKDGVQLWSPAAFRVDAAPGDYEFELKTEGFPADAELVVSGGGAAALSFPLAADRGASRTASGRLSVRAGVPVEFQFPGRGSVLWLSLVQKQEGPR